MVVADLVEVDLRYIRQQIGAGVVVLAWPTPAARDSFLAELVSRARMVFVHQAPSCGKNFRGSTGLPRRRISKCSATPSALVAAHLGDLLALAHALSLLHQKLAVMSVNAQVGAVVLDDD